MKCARLLAEKMQLCSHKLIFMVKDWRLHNSANVPSEDSLFRMNKGVPTVQQIFVCFFMTYAIVLSFFFCRFLACFCHFYDYFVSPSSSFVAGNDIPLFPHYSVCYVASLLIFPPKLTFSNECRSKTCLCQKFLVPLHAVCVHKQTTYILWLKTKVQ